MGKLTKKIRPTEKNLEKIPNQSGVYLLYEGNKPPYVGSAGGGRLQERIREQLKKKRRITTIRYKPTSSKREARKCEEKYREKYNPKQKRI